MHDRLRALGRFHVLIPAAVLAFVLAPVCPMLAQAPQGQSVSAQADNADALRDLASARIRTNQFDEAVTALESYLERRPYDRAARVDLARVLSWSRRFDEASREYRRVLEEDPASIESEVGLAQIIAWQGRYAEAMGQFEAVLNRQPDQREALIGVAQALYWTGRTEEGLQQFTSLEQRFPEDREIASLAASLRKADDARGAVSATAVAVPDAVVDERLDRARRFSAARDYAQAVAVYEEVIEDDPDNIEARIQMARILSWDRQYTRSIAAYEDAIARAPRNRDARVEHARVHAWSGRLDDAVRLFSDLEREYPADRDVLLGKAQSLQWSGHSREAARILAPLQAAFPDDRDVRVAMASTHLGLGRPDLALQELDQVGASDADVEAMRRLASRQVQSTLTIGYNPSKDSDDLLIRPLVSTLAFTTHPRVRSYVRGVFTPSEIPSHATANGGEATFGSVARLTDTFTARGEIGTNIGADNRYSAIGGGGFTLTPAAEWRFDVDVARQFLNYLPIAYANNISRATLRTGMDYRPVARLLLHADYTRGWYSDDNRSHAGNVVASYAVVRRPRFTAEGGYLWSLSGADAQTGHGYYSPSRLARHAGLANLSGRLSTRVGYFVAGTLGVEQEEGAAWRMDGSIRGSVDVMVSERVTIGGGYGYFQVAQLNTTGAYGTHAVTTTLEFRF